MTTIWIVWNQFQSHEYYLDCAKITNQSHEFYLECAFFTNQRREFYLDQLFYSALKSKCMYCIALVRTQALCHSKAFNCKPGFVRCIENASHLHTNEKILGMSSFKPALLNTHLALNQMCKNQIQSARFFSSSWKSIIYQMILLRCLWSLN